MKQGPTVRLYAATIERSQVHEKQSDVHLGHPDTSSPSEGLSLLPTTKYRDRDAGKILGDRRFDFGVGADRVVLRLGEEEREWTGRGVVIVARSGAIVVEEVRVAVARRGLGHEGERGRA